VRRSEGGKVRPRALAERMLIKDVGVPIIAMAKGLSWRRRKKGGNRRTEFQRKEKTVEHQKKTRQNFSEELKKRLRV